MADFLMPSLGADMEAGVLVAWRRKPGDTVARGDVIAEVETDKGVLEVEVFEAGVIQRLLVEPGAKVPVGTALAVIGADADAGTGTGAGAGTGAGTGTGAGAGEGIRMSPAARRRARELGLDPARFAGGEAHAVIDVAAVERAAELAPKTPSGSAAPEDKSQRMREAIAAAMARSKREIPHYYLGTDVELGTALGWLEQRNAGRPVTQRLLPGVLFLRAVARALREVPELNARWDGKAAPVLPRIHVGVAIALRGGGLVAPAILDTDTLELDALMERFKDLVQRARTGMLRASELSEPTITVTSLGERGVETMFPVIYPPQVAIVGFGKIVDRPWVVAGQLCVRPVVKATLAADHRVSDGHRGALFLAAVARHLQNPEAP